MKRFDNKKNIFKAIKFATIAMVFVVFTSLFGISAFAETNGNGTVNISTEKIKVSGYENVVENFVEPIFGERAVSVCEYAYNLDGSADFIYVEFAQGGYVIFAKDTMEMIEYSLVGESPFGEFNGERYYAGPANYLRRNNNDQLVNSSTGEIIDITEAEIKSFSVQLRNYITSNEKQKYDIEISNLGEDRFSDLTTEEKDSERSNSAPPINTKALILASTGVGTLIPNYKYFLANPTHGENLSDTCGPIVAQLLLGYHNYYSDRRIIQDRFLNGYNDSTNSVSVAARNPNHCNDPMSMTKFTTGTRSEATGTNSFYAEMISRIMTPDKVGSTTAEVADGMTSFLNERITSTGYTIEYEEKGWFFGYSPIDSSLIKSEIDAGRPVIIAMDVDLQGINHFVLGYGYQNYTYADGSGTYEGYVVHFGWSGDICVWINSSWCDGYLSLNINHVHDYEWEKAITTTRDEYKCSICGHRTDAAVDLDAIDKYEECLFSLTQGESQYCYLVFATTGHKLIQTFGNQNTKLYLYDSEYTLILQDDNSGFGDNAYFSIYATANEPYWLKVEHLGPSYYSNLKIGVTPLSSYSVSSNSITNETSYSGVQYYVSTNLNATKVYAFTPTESGTFIFKTTKYGNSYVDTYLYVVDTESAIKCQYNDDSGGNLQASITKDLIGGRTYFIVVSTYNITNTTGQFYLDISRQ